jgi:hypothetical protein
MHEKGDREYGGEVMGYVAPYIPIQTIQYKNRVNFERWPAVSEVMRTDAMKGKSSMTDAYGNRSKGSTTAEINGKGKAFDASV